MAITTILVSGSTAANSADQMVESGAIVNLLATGSGSLTVCMKTAAGTYRPIGSLSGVSDEKSGASVQGPMTFKVFRSDGQTVGCDLDDGT